MWNRIRRNAVVHVTVIALGVFALLGCLDVMLKSFETSMAQSVMAQTPIAAAQSTEMRQVVKAKGTDQAPSAGVPE